MTCLLHQAPRGAVGVLTGGEHAGRLVQVIDPEIDLESFDAGSQVQFLDTGAVQGVNWFTYIEVP
jgi:hypothetical protein